ncbi:hypothetical protein NDU88_002205 [Pleurodeles waltl]|uniref:DDE Tnp4 domain-containing protein n=1 Tax=Pleurodeles waltl TaxID=8319 RepID=A0AAV7WNX0_PLEWA|nr:hypothetical protein NDU88_002205 [Pleurodeles waltl]
MNVHMVCLADQYISHVNAKFPGSVHDAYILRNSSILYVMGQLQRHRVWLLGDSGYPNLSWLLNPVRNPRTRAEERYNEAHGRTRRIIERTFGLLKARFRWIPILLTKKGVPDHRGLLYASQLSAAVCTANGIPRLKDRHVHSWVVIVWAYICWRDGGGFVFANLSLTFGVADLCACLNFGGFRAVGRNGCGGIPRPRRCVGWLLHCGKRLLPPML